MPISPIDFITIAPKSQEASHVQAGHESRQAQANAMVNTQFQQHVEQNSRQAVQKANADNEKYRYDAKEKGNNSEQNKKKKKNTKNSDKKEQEKTERPRHFDMKF